MGDHINKDGQFQSDKYSWALPGFVPLKVTDPMAQDLLWAYAQLRRAVDPEFADDLEIALVAAGYKPTSASPPAIALPQYPTEGKSEIPFVVPSLLDIDDASAFHIGIHDATIPVRTMRAYVPPVIDVNVQHYPPRNSRVNLTPPSRRCPDCGGDMAERYSGKMEGHLPSCPKFTL